MNKKPLLKSNKGGSLILVIGCVALLSMVGAMLLLVTTNNRRMKDLERQAQQSFFGAESGSNEMVTQLEIEAEAALKKAFEDLLVQYSNYPTESSRDEHYAQYFQAALTNEVNKTNATNVMRKALGLSDTEPLKVDVKFDDVITKSLVGDVSEIYIKKAEFSYTTDKGVEAKISTDISIKTQIPDLENGLGDAESCDFMDFALITGADVSSGLASSQHVTVNGNMYTKGSFNNEGNVVNVNYAKKLLVGKDIVIGNKAKMNISSGTNAQGEGVWANNITVKTGGELVADSNFYISDDLSISDSDSKAVISGREYVGYSGGDASVDASAANSAVTINTSKDITLDFSGTDTLILTGTSYIHDAIWGSVGLTGDDASANMLGILQGESLAYKDMQSMYLVPGECLTTGHNPMTKEEYNEAVGADGSIEILFSTSRPYVDTTKPLGQQEKTFELDSYLADKKYIVRHVKLDGGTTEFVYLYLNFKDDKAASRYFSDYMAIDALAGPLKEQLSHFGNSIIKLASNNYTLANAFAYDYTDGTYSVSGPTTSYSYLSNSSFNAKKWQNGLFTSFRKDTSGPAEPDYDIIGQNIVKMDVLNATTADTWVKNPYADYEFWVYNGEGNKEVVIDEDPKMSGIILVDGKVTFKASGMNFSGLVIATEGVVFDSETTISANKTAVQELMKQEGVAKYFMATGTGVPASPYLSSSAVSITFKNWEKN